MKKIIKKRKNILWIILLIVGCSPYVYNFFKAVSSATNGYLGFCIGGYCTPTYGITAFKETFFWGFILFWPIYLIATILIIISVIMLIKKPKKK